MSTTETGTGASQAWLVLAIGDARVGIAAASVEEVCDAAELAPLPRAPDHLLGLMSLRGEPLPVVDLGRFLGLANSGAGDAGGLTARVVVVNEGSFRVGLSCRRVSAVRPSDELHALERVRGGRIEEFAVGEFDCSAGWVAALDLLPLLNAARFHG